jgi:hypothetical protein
VLYNKGELLYNFRIEKRADLFSLLILSANGIVHQEYGLQQVHHGGEATFNSP